MSYTFVEEYFNSLYLKEDQQGKVIALFTMVAFIITCLGLYGQVLQVALNRTKEIGIRRVNGATVREIISMLNREFLVSVIIAYSVALPFSFAIISKWLENFAYKTRQNWWIYFLTGVFVVAIVLITVTWQTWRAATRNPVEALRYE
jgi:putative ABC transport system permease protein